MKTHRSTLHVSVPTQTASAEDSAGSTRADPVGRTVRGIAILTLVLGSGLGAEVAATSGHSGAHPSAFKMPTSSVTKPHIISHRPWMY